MSPDIYEEIDGIPREKDMYSLKLIRKELCLFQNDPIDDELKSLYQKDSISVWGGCGKLAVSMENYVKYSALGMVQAMQTPVDNEAKKSLKDAYNRKRCKKAFERTSSYLSSFRLYSEKFGHNVPLLYSISGGNLREFRLKQYESFESDESSGFCIDGIYVHSNFNEVEAEESENASPHSREHVFKLLSETVSGLPVDKMKFCCMLWQPNDVIQAVNCGVDLFDGSLPYRLSRSGIAWLYDKNGKECDYLIFPDNERFYQNRVKETGDDGSNSFKMPVQKDCSCFCCKTHNRAYLSHLFSVHEMLGPILLMIHNSHQCYRFFQDIREAIASDKFPEFSEKFKNYSFPNAVMVNRVFGNQEDRSEGLSN